MTNKTDTIKCYKERNGGLLAISGNTGGVDHYSIHLWETAAVAAELRLSAAMVDVTMCFVFWE